MVTIDHTKAAKTAVALAALAAASALAGCGARPYPSPAHETYVRSVSSTELAGPGYAPPPEFYGAPGPSSTVTESYGSYGSNTYGPPATSGSTPIYTLPPIQPTRPYVRNDSPVVYDLGPVQGHHRVHRRFYGYSGAAPRQSYVSRRVHHSHAPTNYVAEPRVAVAPHPVAPSTYTATTADRTHAVVNGAKVAAAAAVASAADAAHSAAMAAQNVAGGASSNTTTTTKTETAVTGAAGDRTTRLAALQTALTSAVASKAVLAAADKMAPGQPADVSLTLPADFADLMRKEAEKDGLADAAASANMTASLAGDGYAVTPAEQQSQPLTVGQPTEFHWTVTAQPNAHGPLHADVGADLLGGGSDTLNLGTVQKGGGSIVGMKLTPKMLGAGILALIVILVLGWLARGRSPSRSAAARRAARNARYYGGERPLDMGPE